MQILLDSLKNLVSGLGTSKDKTTSLSHYLRELTLVELNSMHRGDWLSRKIVDVPAQDMTRKWRSWKGTTEQIERLERYEKLPTIDVQRKVKRALQLSRLFGGSALFVGTGDARTDLPLDADRMAEGSLRYVAALQRTQLSAQARIDDPSDPYYGHPEMYLMSVQGQQQLRIHPSRLVVFQGSPILDEQIRGYLPWGDPTLQVVYDAIQAATHTHQEIAALVAEAKTDVIHVPKLSEFLRTADSTSKLTSRFTYANQMKSSFNMLLLEGDGKGAGEQWEQKQLNFANLPELMQQFLQIVSGAADMPATRLLGQSPSGMNATGESDTRNYYDMLSSKQKTELTPDMRVLDTALRRSAIGQDDGVYYEWNPLWELSETEQVANFEKRVTAVRKLVGSAAEEPLLPVEAVSRAVLNMLEEDGSLPGLADYVEEYGYPDEQDDDEDDDLAAASGETQEEETETTEQEAGDMRPRTLYVSRRVVNASEILDWAREQGISSLQNEEDLHVTVTYSRQTVDWMKMGQSWEEELVVPRGGPRALDLFGDLDRHLVLQFASTELQWRHESMVRNGASWDWDEYLPHITIGVDTGLTVEEVEAIGAYTGRIVLGPEIFEEVRSD